MDLGNALFGLVGILFGHIAKDGTKAVVHKLFAKPAVVNGNGNGNGKVENMSVPSLEKLIRETSAGVLVDELQKSVIPALNSQTEYLKSIDTSSIEMAKNMAILVDRSVRLR